MTRKSRVDRDKSSNSRESFMGAVLTAGLTRRPLRHIADEFPELVKGIRDLHPLTAASRVAGLLIQPELQASCLRLEVLVHLFVALSNGRKKLNAGHVRRLFEVVPENRTGC